MEANQERGWSLPQPAVTEPVFLGRQGLCRGGSRVPDRWTVDQPLTDEKSEAYRARAWSTGRERQRRELSGIEADDAPLEDPGRCAFAST